MEKCPAEFTKMPPLYRPFFIWLQNTPTNIQELTAFTLCNHPFPWILIQKEAVISVHTHSCVPVFPTTSKCTQINVRKNNNLPTQEASTVSKLDSEPDNINKCIPESRRVRYTTLILRLDINDQYNHSNDVNTLMSTFFFFLSDR